MPEPQPITDEVVEAAACAEFTADMEADHEPQDRIMWDQALGFVQKAYRDRARAGLSAAYPLLVEGLKADRDDLAAAVITFTERRATDRAEIARLTADESKYRQLWAAQVRDRQSKPRDPAKDAAESAMWETVREIVRRAEAERDAARRELATVAEKIAAAIEAKRGPGQSGRYVAALTKAADIARTFGVQPGTGSDPKRPWPPSGYLCLVRGNDCPGHPSKWMVCQSSDAPAAGGLPEQNGEAEPPESLPTGPDEISSPDTWSTATSITEEETPDAR